MATQTLRLADNNAAMVRDTYEAYNERDFARAVKCFAEDAEIENVALGVTLHGHEGYLQYVGGWATAFPDSTVKVTDVIAGDLAVAVEFVGSGTHLGTLRGPEGDIAPTGRRCEVRFCDVCTVKDGKIAGVRTYFDVTTMMRQLGL